jgi:tRNA1(Val) A37 N6-methylase TrmN6
MRTTERLGRYVLTQEESLPKVSRDSLMLSRFATLKRGWRVFDMGCGAGVLGLCLARREEGLTLDGMDIVPECVRLTRLNLTQNGLSGSIWQGDVAQPPRLDWGSYDLVISNPPYFRREAGKTAPGNRGVARTGDGTEHWCALAARLLKNGGRFALCLRPEGLNGLFHDLTRCGMEPKRMQQVQSAEGKNANLVMVEAVRQGRPGLTLLSALTER